MPEWQPPEFDFDYWYRLARENPERFEEVRAQAIEAFIAGAPPALRHRLRGLQWQVDQIRARAGTPLAACLRLSSMMWDKVLGERGLLETVQALSRPVDDADAPEEAPSAAILPFRTPDPDA